MSDASKEPAFVRVTTGVAGLDMILGGGLMRGGIYIVQGAPGAGKTILSNQICFHHIAQGGRGLFVTLLAENHARMMLNLREMDFFDEDKIPDQLLYLSALQELREGRLTGLVALLRREIQRNRITMLVIDGLVSAQDSAESDQAFKAFIHALQEIALATDCTMILTTNTSVAISPEQTMADGLIELKDRIHGWQAESELHVKKFRGSRFVRGLHSYVITQAGIVVYPRIEALFANPSRADDGSVGRVSSGVDRLDTILGGGLPTASTTMVMGPSGIGKTSLGLQFLARSSTTEPGLLFGFYETRPRLRAKADGVCAPLGPLLDDGVVEILWQTPTGDLLDAYGERLLAAVSRRGVKRLFIDGLTAFRSAAIDPTRIGYFFSALANELRVRGVTTVYSLEVPDILGPAVRVPVDDASSLAENMVLMRFIELRSQLHRLVSVLKVRDSDFDPSLHEFNITATGLNISETSASAESVLLSLADGIGRGALRSPAGRGSSRARSPRV